MVLNDLEPSKKEFLVNFSQFLDAALILTLNCDEIAEDRPRQPAQFSALNVDFNSLSLDSLVSRRLTQTGVKTATPPEKWLFYRNYLV